MPESSSVRRHLEKGIETMVLGLFTAVYILGGATPDVLLIPQKFLELGACHERETQFNKNPDHEPYTDDGKPILAVYYKCQALGAADIDEANAALKSK